MSTALDVYCSVNCVCRIIEYFCLNFLKFILVCDGCDTFFVILIIIPIDKKLKFLARNSNQEKLFGHFSNLNFI